MIIEFEGIPSGDYESFVWAVDIETYKRIKGESFGEYSDLFNKSPFYEGLYMIYPGDIFKSDTKQRIKIEITEITQTDD